MDILIVAPSLLATIEYHSLCLSAFWETIET